MGRVRVAHHQRRQPRRQRGELHPHVRPDGMGGFRLPGVPRDGPGMASKIKRVIGRSYCLLAIVTNATNASWWVPFEIGVASETNKFLSTYGSPRVPMPSFLSVWPRVKDEAKLRSWCALIKQQKAKYMPTTHRGFVELAGSQRTNYTSDMRALARRFPGTR